MFRRSRLYQRNRNVYAPREVRIDMPPGQCSRFAALYPEIGSCEKSPRAMFLITPCKQYPWNQEGYIGHYHGPDVHQHHVALEFVDGSS